MIVQIATVKRCLMNLLEASFLTILATLSPRLLAFTFVFHFGQYNFLFPVLFF